MVCGALLIIRITVGKIYPSVLCIGQVELIIHLIIGGRICQLVSQYQTAGARFVKETLVVNTPIEGGTAHLHVGSGAVRIAVAINTTAHIGRAITIVLHMEGGDTRSQS